jgi:hypothetical protein
MDNSTAARRCFAIPELIHAIFGSASSGRGRAHVVKYACTLWKFSQPALDALWRDMDTLAPLLRLFRAEVIAFHHECGFTVGRSRHPHKDRSSRRSWQFERPPAGAEWDRFDAHAALEVRDLDGDANGMGAGVFATRGTWPLPHLRRLAWRALRARAPPPPAGPRRTRARPARRPRPGPRSRTSCTCASRCASPDEDEDEDEKDMPEREDGALIAECVSALVECGPALETLAVTVRGACRAYGTCMRT